ncbi:hypothetical protein RND81_11G175500 [Saponaria officinalis]|uniref:Arogenate dehydratase n=1 Tax=Saponaria officinalis TaxID=3572 RepID=A0AAW1HQ23_SAPOF
MGDIASEMPRLRVAYQGVPGAYSQFAAEKAYPNCEAVPCEEFENVFEDLEKGLVDRAILPIENSLGGSIHRNYDLLLRHTVHIEGEVKVVIRHCLLANHGVKLHDIKRVLSHPQALAQCETTLAKFGIAREAANDTARSAQYIADNQLKDVGAVASATAAKIYGLNILLEDIQDNSRNITRFLMLAREPAVILSLDDKPFKTSIVISLHQGPRDLFKALAVFSMRQINLTKIESRPIRDTINGSLCFNYFFHLDIEASTAVQNVQNAIKHLEEFASSVLVLGSYPSDMSIT